MGPTSKRREKGGRGEKGSMERGREEGEGKKGKGKRMEGKNVLPHVKQAVAAYGCTSLFELVYTNYTNVGKSSRTLLTL